ncbi:hypothetical protein GCM10010399_79090 [Dactylosporangium fulvum]|uniref:Protein phosphatase 2C domain-containing protein n=1 Tax=Dactylosporangium fulvum TaxID=53359 RepID=A0ABY5W1S9_9ACTN|nr:protein phosphatase 2C domain-containing protein [Dactylosporangium fulvum]UWP83224.1 protein phosphatase 2C domain-containing protein [Dactylosporangium fulvum]
MSEKILPIYLLVDLGGPAGGPKSASVNAFYQRFVEDLKADPDLAKRVRLTLGGFGDKLTRYLLSVKADLLGNGVLPVGGPRSYATAFHTVEHWIREDTAQFLADGAAVAHPLLLIFTDAPPVAGDEWEVEFRALTVRHPKIVVMPINHFDGHRWSGVLRYSADGSFGRDRQEPEDPVIAARAIVQEHVASTVPRPRPTPPAEAPSWQGAFTPYRVGDPGNAALKVRPRPGPAEWDRRDTVLDGVVIAGEPGGPEVELRAASVRGLAHRYNGTVRQDEYAFRCTEDGRHLVLAVSDGVSNSRLSHKAAALVCRTGADLTATGLALKPPADLDWGGLMVDLSQGIVDLARRLLDPPALTYGEVAVHMAATALFGVVELHPEHGDDVLLAHIGSIGDSSAWVLRGGTRWEPLQDVKNSDAAVASTTTKALPLRSADVAVLVRTVWLRRGDALVLMSDGVGDPLLDGTGTVGQFLAESWRVPPPPIQFAAQVDFARRSHDDDRTAVAIWVV